MQKVVYLLILQILIKLSTPVVSENSIPNKKFFNEKFTKIVMLISKDPLFKKIIFKNIFSSETIANIKEFNEIIQNSNLYENLMIIFNNLKNFEDIENEIKKSLFELKKGVL